MVTTEQVITWMAGIIGFLVATLLMSVKSWQKKHDQVHTDIDHRIDKLTECVSTNKRDIAGFTSRCQTRCQNEDDIFSEIKLTLSEATKRIDKFLVAIANQNEKIVRLQERIRQLDRRERLNDDDQR